MVIKDRRSTEFAANFVTKMLATTSLLLANCLTAELLPALFPALYFTINLATIAELFNHSLALRAATFMATSRADMPTFKLFATRHSANGNNL